MRRRNARINLGEILLVKRTHPGNILLGAHDEGDGRAEDARCRLREFLHRLGTLKKPDMKRLVVVGSRREIARLQNLPKLLPLHGLRRKLAARITLLRQIKKRHEKTPPYKKRIHTSFILP